MPGRLRRLLALVLALLLSASPPAGAFSAEERKEDCRERAREREREEASRENVRKCYYIDVVVANQGDLHELGRGEFDQLLMNRGRGTFIAKRLPPGPRGMVFDPVTGEVSFKRGAPTTSAFVALADVDGDGDLDIFVANHGFVDSDDFLNRAGESNVLLINRGNGTFTARALDPPGHERNNTHVVAGDRDNDGDIDFLVSSDGNPVRMYTNDGNGNFTATDVTESLILPGFDFVFAALGPVTGEPRRSLEIALGDLNGNGYLDAIVVYDGDWNQVLINKGDGSFYPAVDIIDPAHMDSESVAIAPLTSSGRLDALVAGDGDGVVLYRNDGVGADGKVYFTPIHVDGMEGLHSKAIAIGDFDGDGDFDAFLVNTTLAADIPVAEYPMLLLNDGYGNFQVIPLDGIVVERRRLGRVRGPDTRGEMVVAADFDGDGDLDVFIGNVTVRGIDFPHHNVLLRNDGLDSQGNIIFTPIPVPGRPRVTDGLAAGDVDGNGYLPAVKYRLPNINPHRLLPKRFP